MRRPNPSRGSTTTTFLSRLQSRPGRLAPGLLAAWLLIGSPVRAAELPDRAFPISPDHQSVVGGRPVFSIGYAASEDLEQRELRFRLTLAPTGNTGRTLVFDQRERRRGWLPGEGDSYIFRPFRPVPDGSYRWRVEFWSGVEWIGGGDSHELTIDSVPPAEVTDLQVRADRELGGMILEWQPVAADRDGRPEFVRRYHIYRYEQRPFFSGALKNEVGVSELPRFEDRTPLPDGLEILYYRVAAEDLAGNEAGKRR